MYAIHQAIHTASRGLFIESTKSSNLKSNSTLTNQKFGLPVTPLMWYLESDAIK